MWVEILQGELMHRSLAHLWQNKRGRERRREGGRKEGGRREEVEAACPVVCEVGASLPGRGSAGGDSAVSSCGGDELCQWMMREGLTRFTLKELVKNNKIVSLCFVGGKRGWKEKWKMAQRLNRGRGEEEEEERGYIMS